MKLVSITDQRADRRDAAARAHPRAALLADPSLVIGDPGVDLEPRTIAGVTARCVNLEAKPRQRHMPAA